MPITAESAISWIDSKNELATPIFQVHSLTDSKVAFPTGRTFLVRKEKKLLESGQSLTFTSSDGALVDVSNSSLKKVEAPEFISQKVSRKPESFRLLRKFDGVVVSLEDEKISVRLYETSSGLPRADVAFQIEEFPDSDKPLVAEGVPIVWTIGLGKTEAGSVERKSIVYVRRIMPPTKEEIEKSRAELEELLRGNA